MIFVGIVFAIFGWLTAIWLPTIVGVGFIVVGAIFVSKEEGLSAIVPLILTMVYSVSFLLGKLYISESSILEGLSYIFTGGN